MGCAVHHSLSFLSLPSAVQSTDNRIISAPAGAEVEVWDLRGLLVGRFDRLTDRSGEPVAELAEATAISTFIWSPAASLPSGIYLIRATTQDGRQITKRIAYIR